MTQAADLKNLLGLKKLTPDSMEEIIKSEEQSTKEDSAEESAKEGLKEATAFAFKEDTKADPPSVTYDGPAYRGIFLHQVIRKNGTRLKPGLYGVYQPTTEEDIASLDYYVSVGRAEKLN